MTEKLTNTQVGILKALKSYAERMLLFDMPAAPPLENPIMYMAQSSLKEIMTRQKAAAVTFDSRGKIDRTTNPHRCSKEEFEAAFKELERWKYIEVTGDQYHQIAITAAGLHALQTSVGPTTEMIKAGFQPMSDKVGR